MNTSKEDTTARLDAIDKQLAYLVRQQEKTAELFAEMTPILREVMATATTKLDELEKKGYFAFGKELLGLGERVVEGFGPEDVRKLGDATVGILQTVRAMTQPRILEIAGEASEVLAKSDEAEPLGLLGMVRATRDDDVQKGMAVMMEIMRHVGRAARAVEDQRKADPNAEKKAKLAAVLGPRKKKVLGVERPARAAGAPAAAAAPARDLGPPAACGEPDTRPRAVAAVIEGIGFGADGHLANPAQWTPAIAQRLAAAQGITLDETRWAVVTFARADFEATTTSPNIRRLTQGTDLTTKDLYTLFPKAPARTVAKIAGIPKPAGCI
jgi:TusE/DsrC/DsvC family sulfur relay protein